MKKLFLALSLATFVMGTAAVADEVVSTSKTVTVEHNNPHYYNHHRYHHNRHCYYNRYHHYVCHYYH